MGLIMSFFMDDILKSPLLGFKPRDALCETLFGGLDMGHALPIMVRTLSISDNP